MQARTKRDAEGAVEAKRAGLRGKSFVEDKISEVDRPESVGRKRPRGIRSGRWRSLGNALRTPSTTAKGCSKHL